MRDVLSKRRDYVYTYSNDFMGSNFPMVDEFRIQQVKSLCLLYSVSLDSNSLLLWDSHGPLNRRLRRGVRLYGRQKMASFGLHRDHPGN